MFGVDAIPGVRIKFNVMLSMKKRIYEFEVSRKLAC